MRRLLPIILMLYVAGPAMADIFVAARTIPARTIVGDDHIALGQVGQAAPGLVGDPAEILGLEALRTVYGGRPLVRADFTAPAVVERNGLVEMTYSTGGISILTEGRSLDRGAVGARVQIMNLSSRQTVTATVTGPGRVSVP